MPLVSGGPVAGHTARPEFVTRMRKASSSPGGQIAGAAFSANARVAT
jgi:hypothetical protein